MKYPSYNALFGVLRIFLYSGIILCFFSILNSDFTVQAQYIGSDQKPVFKFERIYEGLSSGRISAIHQDQKGYIWIGTHSGLHRYNGIDFHIYNSSSDTTTIINDYIGDIFEDSDNNLWIGTGGGLNKYNRETDSFERFIFHGSDLHVPETASGVNNIVEDNEGTLWVAGGEENLYKMKKGSSELLPFGFYSDMEISSIYYAGNNELWFSTWQAGIVKINTVSGEILEQFKHDPSDPTSIVTNAVDPVIQDRHGNVWVGSRGSGLIRVERTREGPVFHYYEHERNNPNSLGNNFVFSMYLDKEERLWIGNENGGLHLYDEESDSFFRYMSDPRDSHSLTDNSIWSIYQDRNGRYWIGTGQTGINVADIYASKFEHFHTTMLRDGLGSLVIRDIIEDNEGNLWIATDGGGLTYFDRVTGSFTTYTHDPDDPNSITADAVIHLNFDSEDNLWIGNFRGEVNILTDRDSGRFITFQDKIGNYDFPILSVFAVHFDENYEQIWLAAFEEGLYRYDINSGELLRIDVYQDDVMRTSSNYIIHIFEDSSNNIWFSSLEGLTLLKEENKSELKFNNYEHDRMDHSSLPSNILNHIEEDHNQNIWVATAAGLSKFDFENEKFNTLTIADGLPSNDVRSLILDDNNRFWVGTNKGISQFDPDSLTFKNYTRADGLQSNEFSRYSVHKLRSGEIAFGGINGFNLFHPDRILDNPYPPPVYFTDFKLLNQSVEISDNSPLTSHISVTESITLSYDQNILTFEFIALNYTQAGNNQYAYMMEGFEENWNYVGNQRNATYTNLNPGEYVFRVKASNNDGIWNEDGASIRLIITPPFWQTIWFELLSALFIIGLILTVYRIRVRSIRDRNLQLEKEVTERTEELNVKNSDLALALKELEETKDELVEKAHKAGMADIATGVLHNVGNILNSVNTSASLIENTVKNSKIEKLSQANAMLRENIERIDDFIVHDKKGKQLLEYYLAIEEPLKDEQAKVLLQFDRLVDKINLINEVISAQQGIAGASIHANRTSLSEMIDNALSLESGSIERHGLIVEKDLKASNSIIAQRTKLIHILVNIFKNAKEAMVGNAPQEKKVTIKTWEDENHVYLSVTDNGSGINKENLNKIFTQGFTTKKKGHGFGLHSCANYMTEMGGNIEVFSEGEGKGATFTLSFSVIPESDEVQSNGNQLMDTTESAKMN